MNPKIRNLIQHNWHQLILISLLGYVLFLLGETKNQLIVMEKKMRDQHHQLDSLNSSIDGIEYSLSTLQIDVDSIESALASMER